jgi:hypothetical protein
MRTFKIERLILLDTFMFRAEIYKAHPRALSEKLTVFILSKEKEENLDELPQQIEENNVIIVIDGIEIQVLAGKTDADYVFPKPLLVNRVGFPSSISDGNVSLNYVQLNGEMIYGLKVSQDLPFIYLETSEGTKLVSMSEIKEPKSTTVEQPTQNSEKKKSRSVRRAKKAGSKRKSKGKGTRKSRRV